MLVPPDGFSYHPTFLNTVEAAALVEQLERLDYQHDTFRGKRLRRGYAQFGYSYVTTGRRLVRALPFPDFLNDLAQRCVPLCLEGTRFNQCIVTDYPADSGIDWHADAPVFGETIVAVSLGEEGLLTLRRNGAKEACWEQKVGHGSLYVMTGPARWDYQHRIAPLDARRFSVTLRQVDESE